MNLKVDISVTEMLYSEDPQAVPEFEEPEIIPTLGTVRDNLVSTLDTCDG